MPYKAKIEGPDKVAAIERYLRGEDSLNHIATLLKVSFPTVKQWLQTYQSLGPDGLLSSSQKSYPEAVKQRAVSDYLAKTGSHMDICKRYGIKSTCQLRYWILKYKVNPKRIYSLMDLLHLKSVCRKKRKRYVPSVPETMADNILNRNFTSERFGEKWLTDVTEMKYGNQSKAYVSAILDLSDKSIVSFVMGRSNNELVFRTFDIAHQTFPNAKPLFHSDRGFQYTSKTFKQKLEDAEMTQSRTMVRWNPFGE